MAPSLAIILLLFGFIERRFLLDEFRRMRHSSPLLLIVVDELLHFLIAIATTLPILMKRPGYFLPLIILFSIVDVDHILTAKSLKPRDLFFEAERTPLHSVLFAVLFAFAVSLFTGDAYIGIFTGIIILAHILRDSIGNGTPLLFPIRSSIPHWLSILTLSTLPLLSSLVVKRMN